MVNRARSLFIIGAALLLASCHKDICMDHHHDGMKLRVEFDWTDLNPTTVQGMTLLLYPVEGGSPLRFPFSDINGGTISVTSGTYRVLCVNDDELLRLENADNWETVSVTTGETELISRSAFNNTRSSIPRAEGTEEEPVLREPPLLYTDTCTNFYVKATEETQVLRLTPKMPLGLMHIRVEDISNLQFLQTVSCAVTGLARSLNLTSLKPSDDDCTMPVNLYVTPDNVLEGSLYYFGHCPVLEHAHNLCLYTMLIDTSKQANIYDVTPQLHPDPDPGGGNPGGEPGGEDKNPNILIPALPLPTPQPAEGGFVLQLDEWNTQSINIKM